MCAGLPINPLAGRHLGQPGLSPWFYVLGCELRGVSEKLTQARCGTKHAIPISTNWLAQKIARVFNTLSVNP